MGSRTWIKIYCDKWLNGTIREESPELRGIWVDLLVLAGSGRYGDSGEIKITDHVGFLDGQLADLLQISRQKWATIKEKLVETDRVIIKNGNIIGIKNWSKYQSEYIRQRPYRQLEDTKESSPESCNQKLQREVTTKSATGDRDTRLEKENRDKDTVSQYSTIEDALEVYKKNITLNEELSEDTENELKIACEQFSPAWVIDAIKEACCMNNRSWRYIAGILKNWRRYGKGAKFPKKKE